MRKKLYDVLQANNKSKLSFIYNMVMMIVIITSLVILAFKDFSTPIIIIDRITAVFFSIDYLLRLITADYQLKKRAASFFIYPFTPMALIDILCILPSFGIITGSVRILKVLRFVRCIKVLRVYKVFKKLNSIKIIWEVIKKEKGILISICILAVVYVLVVALAVFNIEPDTFGNFFEALYWSVISLTTIGYGDIVPVTVVGRIFTMISSIMGIAIIALPSGTITAGYMEVLNERHEEYKKEREKEKEKCENISNGN